MREDPPGGTDEGRAHQETQTGTKALGKETPDSPESPAPPHLEAPKQPKKQQPEEALAQPPPGERFSYNNLHPSYNNNDLDCAATTPLLLSRFILSTIL